MKRWMKYALLFLTLGIPVSAYAYEKCCPDCPPDCPCPCANVKAR